MDGRQLWSQLPQHGNRSWLIVDEYPAFARGGDFTAQNNFAGGVINSGGNRDIFAAIQPVGRQQALNDFSF